MKLAKVYLQNILSVVKTNKVFYLSFVAIWLLGFYLQLTSSQFALSIWINNWNTPLLDTAMVALTYAGDGVFLVLIGALLIAKKREWWICIIVCLVVPSIITQLLKHQVYEDVHRPSVLMAHIPNLHFVKGVVMNQYNSFPSGHTTAAFSLYTLLALLLGYKKYGFIWVLIASLAALSRVYLLQHFWADIMAGSIIGITTCTLLFVWLQPKNKNHAIQK